MQAAARADTRHHILDRLKRRGPASIPDLAAESGLHPETIRAHVRTLTAEGLLRSAGVRRSGRGRPEGLYDLTERAQALFPRREAALLSGLARFLEVRGEQDLLSDFLDESAARRLDEGLARLEGLEGRARLEEVARILSEEGYMAEVSEEASGAHLRLCHCPLRALVEVSRAPCKAEIGLVRSLVGSDLTRIEYLPDGDGACAYAVRREAQP